MFSDFPWNEYCFQVRDPSVCAQCITEVIVSGMEVYIPHTFSLPHVKKPWFNHACSHAIKDREAAYKRYMSLETPENYALYVSAQNRTKSIVRLTKVSIINWKCEDLTSSNSSKDFWHLTKNTSNNFTFSFFPPLLNPNDSAAVTSISKAELFAQTLSANSTLDDSGHIPPTHHASDSNLPVTRVLNNDVFYDLSGLNPQKAYGRDGVSPVVLKNCASVLTTCLVKLFRLCLSTSIFLSC